MGITTQLLEITAIPDTYKDHIFYYGVDSVKDALKVWRQGFIPFPKQRKGKAAVIPGRVYVTGSLIKAANFANIPFGSVWNKNRIRSVGRYGYVFIIGRENLVDIYPNEAVVGRFLQKAYDLQYGDREDFKLSDDAMDFLMYSWDVLNRREQTAVIRDEAEAAPVIGKKLLNNLPDNMILWILNHVGVDLSHEGEISFRTLFRVDRSKLDTVEEDGSNFYDIAERVTSEDDII